MAGAGKMASPKPALLVVDVQYDFLPGGSLSVPEGDAIISRVNRAVGVFQRRGPPVPSPPGWGPAGEAVLHDPGIAELFICGLATDYCIRATTIDATRRGMKVLVLKDAVRGVDVKPGDSDAALREMRAHGASFAETRGGAKGLPPPPRGRA